jgi:DNA repair ATPase RecN
LLNDIELIAVTDHWSIDSAESLLRAASDAGIIALPGFEANTREGVHLLVLFEQGTPSGSINAAIGVCGGSPGGSGAGNESYDKILASMAQRGALVIPAHVNVPSGLLGKTSGQPLQKAIASEHLHVIAISPDAPESADQAAIIAGTAPFDRKHPLAVIFSDDICHPDALAKPSGTSWFKVSEPRLEALKVAVRTPSTRVATTNPTTTSRSQIRRISWVGGFFDDVSIPFAEDLTSLIGGRGTGKSTLVESLRFALGIEPLAAEARQDHKSLISGVLGPGAIVTVLVEVSDPVPTEFTIRRTVGERSIVLDAAGSVTDLTPEDDLGPVEIFGQHELAELAHNPEAVAQMLARFTGQQDEDPQVVQLLESLQTNREQLAKAEIALGKHDADLDDLPRLKAQKARYDESDVATRLEAVSALERDNHAFTEASAVLDKALSDVTILDQAAHPALLAAAPDPEPGRPHADILAQVPAALRSAGSTFAKALDDAKRGLSQAKTAVTEAQAAWSSATEGEKEANDKVLRDLQAEGLEPGKYLAAATAVQRSEDKSKERPLLAAVVDDLLRERKVLLDELQERERVLLEAFHGSVRHANEAAGGKVIVKPSPATDRSIVKALIDRTITQQKNLIKAAIDSPSFTPRSLAQSIREGLPALDRDHKIRGLQASKLVEAGEVLCRELDELSMPQAVEVSLDISEMGDRAQYRSLTQLSRGQRATALLLLLLSASQDPLIIDQPEDDLDNRFVFEGVVTHLRALKGRRQVIVSTHNANVPVLGDAELIIGLESTGQRGKPIENGIGSLDDARVRRLVEDILEGGRAAFDARQHLYGF